MRARDLTQTRAHSCLPQARIYVCRKVKGHLCLNVSTKHPSALDLHLCRVCGAPVAEVTHSRQWAICKTNKSRQRSRGAVLVIHLSSLLLRLPTSFSRLLLLLVLATPSVTLPYLKFILLLSQSAHFPPSHSPFSARRITSIETRKKQPFASSFGSVWLGKEFNWPACISARFSKWKPLNWPSYGWVC